MSRRLSRCVLIPLIGAVIVLSGISGVRVNAAAGDPRFAAVLQRFLSLDDSAPTSYRALRHLDAQNGNLNKTAWMDVWTELDQAGGFKYAIVAESGSEYIRSRVFLASLDAEKKMYASGAPSLAGLTADNYVFAEGVSANGLSAVAVTPRRKDVLLVDGSIFLKPEDGDLVRIEGRLSKAPSFWIRQVDIVRSYRRVAGVRMPVAVEAVASIRLAGKGTFRMTYDYETVNGRRVGVPAPRQVKAEILANAEP